jgi:hypothetical protein
MIDENESMNVFAVTREATQTRHAAHPDHLGPIPEDTHQAEVIQQVGTAFRQNDGSIQIRLDCIPLSGRLLIRPADQDRGQEPRAGH